MPQHTPREYIERTTGGINARSPRTVFYIGILAHSNGGKEGTTPAEDGNPLTLQRVSPDPAVSVP